MLMKNYLIEENLKKINFDVVSYNNRLKMGKLGLSYQSGDETASEISRKMN